MIRKDTLMFGVLAIVAGLVGCLMSGQLAERPVVAEDVQEKIVTRGVEIVDENGLPRIALYVDEAGNPHVWLFDKNLKARVMLNVRQDSFASCDVSDENGGSCISLMSSAAGGAALSVMNSERKLAARLFNRPGYTGLMLSDDNGKMLMDFGLLGGIPRASMREPTGETLWSAP